MPTRLLVDNDVLIKLAHWGLLERLAPSLGAEASQVAALESLQFRARRADKKLFSSTEVARSLADFLGHTSSLPVADLAEIAQLQGIVGLDAGEVALVAACLSDSEALLITGDKRAIGALFTSCPPEITERLCGRVICLEQLMVLMADQGPSSAVIEGIMRCREIDTAVRAVVGPSGCHESSFREGMGAYICDLRRSTGPLLWDG